MEKSYQSYDDAPVSYAKKSSDARLSGLFWLPATLCLIGFLLFGASRTTNVFSNSANLVRKPVFDTVDLSISASNEYGDTTAGKFPYPFLANALLAEPYKSTTFELGGALDACTYTWSVSDVTTGEVANSGSAKSTSFSLTLESVGEYQLSVSEGSCASSRSLVTTVWVKYVRRELSSLTEADREAFLDAFATLWKVNTVDGQALYGENYKSLYYFASIHNDAGANSVCDEFHGNQGFVNNHMFIGAYLEQSLQLVDPSTCLHYLEYVKYFETTNFTAHLSDQLDGGAWTEILSSKWFGANDPISGRIIDGRWENASVPYLNDQYYSDHGVPQNETWFPTEKGWYLLGMKAHMVSPYGLLRSPWNWNDSPYVTRYNNVNGIEDIYGMDHSIIAFYKGVSCSDFKSFLGTVSGSPLSVFLKGCEDNIHGKIHFTFGGAGGDHAAATNEILKNDYGFTDSMLVLLADADQTFVKMTYPQYYSKRLVQPLQCTTFPWDSDTQSLWTTDSPGEANATCALNPYFCESQDTLTEFYARLLSNFQDGNAAQYSVESALLAMNTSTQCEVSNIIAGRMAFDGEMAGSGAALDPLFWVAHGAVERLMHAVIFNNMTTDLIYDVDVSECVGHENTGTKYWLTGYYFQDTSVLPQNLTNVELNEVMNPKGDLYRDYFNFVYDSSDYSFCDGSSEWFQA